MDTQIEYHGPTDTHGRCHFSLRWIDDYFPGHPEGEHVRRERGQQFHADPRKFGHLRPEEDSDDSTVQTLVGRGSTAYGRNV